MGRVRAADLLGADRDRGAGIHWGRDVALTGGCFALGSVLIALGLYDNEDAGPVALFAPLALACAALLLRRVAPQPAILAGAVAVVGDQLLGRSVAAVIIYAELVYEAGVYAKGRFVRILLWIHCAITVVAAAVVVVDANVTAGAGLGVTLFLVLVLPLLSAMTVRHHRDRAAAERQRAEQLARLAEFDRRQAVAVERARMARELHDVIANHLSAVALHATAALSARQAPTGQVRDALVTIRESSLGGLAEMRRMVTILRGGAARPGEAEPLDLPSRPGIGEIDLLLDRARAAGLSVSVETSGSPRTLPVAVDFAAYRIVQESLTNAARHSPGGSARVALNHRPDGLRITVGSWPSQRSPAVDPQVKGSGMGLVGMRERATLLGGAFSAAPSGTGWLVSAYLPTVEPATTAVNATARADVTEIMPSGDVTKVTPVEGVGEDTLAEDVREIGPAGETARREVRAVRPDADAVRPGAVHR